MIIEMAGGKSKPNKKDEHIEETDRLKCWICPAKFFDSTEQYHQHIERIHQGYRFRCEDCENETLFKDIDTARDHVNSCHDIKTHPCPNCDQSFNEFNLRKHLQEVHQKVPQYECSLCKSKPFEDRCSYENHVYNKHQGFRVKCHICHKMLRSKLKTHIEYIHSEGVPRCNICNKEYSNKYKLMRHLKCHTDPREPGASVRCERCNESFESVSKLKYHKAKHQTKIFQCDKCSKMFYRNEALVQHQKTHEEKELL
ncbi:zinc finger protein 319-like [Topomyia yanbarensis]|uniref:zinc finger protein 319-like n=1 Tax=Topomyia yanbarensis TaxID=2498891 RepID=UPI00273CBD34|nr:zinc finger protein 319-like [Topomyia yanbarensis]